MTQQSNMKTMTITVVKKNIRFSGNFDNPTYFELNEALSGSQILIGNCHFTTCAIYSKTICRTRRSTLREKHEEKKLQQ